MPHESPAEGAWRCWDALAGQAPGLRKMKEESRSGSEIIRSLQNTSTG